MIVLRSVIEILECCGCKCKSCYLMCNKVWYEAPSRLSILLILSCSLFTHAFYLYLGLLPILTHMQHCHLEGRPASSSGSHGLLLPGYCNCLIIYHCSCVWYYSEILVHFEPFDFLHKKKYLKCLSKKTLRVVDQQ